MQVTSFLLPPLPFPLWCSPGQGDISFPQKDHPVVLEKVRELRAMRQSDIHRWHHSKQITHSIPTHNPRMSEDAENWNSNFAINSLLKIIEYNTQLTKDWVTCSYRSCPLPPRARDPFTVYVPKTRTWEFKTEVFSLILEVFKTRLDGALGNLTWWGGLCSLQGFEARWSSPVCRSTTLQHLLQYSVFSVIWRKASTPTANGCIHQQSHL